MKDEIKKILDKLKKVANRETASRNALMEMKDKDYQLLLDYITNLQEENERLKKPDYYEKGLIGSIKERDKIIQDYKSRIDKVIQFIKDNFTNEDGEIWHSDMKIIYNILNKEK